MENSTVDYLQSILDPTNTTTYGGNTTQATLRKEACFVIQADTGPENRSERDTVGGDPHPAQSDGEDNIPAEHASGASSSSPSSPPSSSSGRFHASVAAPIPAHNTTGKTAKTVERISRLNTFPAPPGAIDAGVGVLVGKIPIRGDTYAPREEIVVKFRCVNDERAHARFEITFNAKFRPTALSDAGLLRHEATLQLTSRNMTDLRIRSVRAGDLTAIENIVRVTGWTPTHVQALFAQRDELCHITMQYRPEQPDGTVALCGRGLFADIEQLESGGAAGTVLTTLRQVRDRLMTKRALIHVILDAAEVTDSVVDTDTLMREQLNGNDPFLRYWVGGVNVQKGQGLPIDDLRESGYTPSRQVSFVSPLEYVTTMFYSIAFEQAAAEAEAIEHDVVTCIVKLPTHGERQYLAFMASQDDASSLRLRPGDTFDLSFEDPRARVRNAWRGEVLSPDSAAPIGYLTCAIRRPPCRIRDRIEVPSDQIDRGQGSYTTRSVLETLDDTVNVTPDDTVDSGVQDNIATPSQDIGDADSGLDQLELPPTVKVDLEQLGNLNADGIALKIRALSGAKSYCKPDSSDNVFKRQYDALKALWDGLNNSDGKVPAEVHQRMRDVVRLLLANAPSALDTVDFYADLDVSRDVVDAHLESVVRPHMSAGQYEVFRRLRVVHGGLMQIAGPPGTGKSNVLREIVHLWTSLSSDTKPAQILFCAPSNPLVDGLVQHIDKVVSSLRTDGRCPIIIRAHTRSTEHAITRSLAAQPAPSRIVPDHAMLDRAFDEVLGVGEHESARWLLTSFANQQTPPWDGVGDKRATELSHSLAYWILAIAGCPIDRAKNLHPRAQPDTELSRATRRAVDLLTEDSVNVQSADRAAATLALNRMAASVLSMADVVVCTISGALSELICGSQLRPRIVIVEEASRGLESEMLGLLVRFPGCRRFVHGGDYHQTEPVVKANTRREPFTAQSGLSMFSRLGLCGFPRVTLTTNYRFSPSIAELVDLRYNYITTADDVVGDVSRADHSNELAKHLALGSGNSWAFIDTAESVSYKDAACSTYNDDHIDAALYWIMKLLQRGSVKPSDISFVTGYNAQLSRFKLCMQHWVGDCNRKRAIAGHDHHWAENLADVHAETIDTVHGSERDVVILDIPNTTSLGFFSEAPRFTVGVSRPRSLLIILCNYTALSKSYSGKPKAINRSAIGRAYTFAVDKGVLITNARDHRLHIVEKIMSFRESATGHVQTPVELIKPYCDPQLPPVTTFDLGSDGGFMEQDIVEHQSIDHDRAECQFENELEPEDDGDW